MAPSSPADGSLPDPSALGPVVDARSLAAADAAPFVGRAAHLAQLDAAHRRARSRAVVRIVDGPSGMGKSTLMRAFLGDLAAADPAVVVLAGRCHERRAAGLDGLVEALARFLRAQPTDVQEALLPRRAGSLVRLFPALAGVERLRGRRDIEVADAAEQRSRAVAALRELLARVANRWPLVLSLDDVQWADADTAALVADVLRPPDAPTVLLVLACRRDDLARSPLLARMLALARDEHEPLDIGFVHVDALSAEETRALALALVPAAGLAAGVAADAEGDPYLVEELARRALPAGAAPSLDTLLRARIAALPEPARRLLLTLALAGRPLAPALAWRAAGLDPTGADVLDPLVRAHLVRTGPDGAAPVEAWHDRVRASVLAGQDPGVLRARHLQLAEALAAEAEPDAEALAAHLLAAREDRRAAPWCLRAGDAAMATLAFDRAIRHFGDALARGAPPYETRLRLAGALAAAGRGAESARVQLAAAPLAPLDLAQQLRGEAALNLLLQGRFDEGVGVLKDALERIGQPLAVSPWRALVSVLWRRAWLRLRGRAFTRRAAATIDLALLARIDTLWCASVGLGTFDPLRSADAHARGMMLALRAGEPLRVARVVSMELLHTAVGGSRAQARTHALTRESLALAAEVDDPRVTAASTLNRGIAAFLEGQFAEARVLMERADDELRTRCAGATWERDTLNRFYVRVLTCLGDLAAIVPFTRAVVRDAEERGDGRISAHVRLRTLHLVQLCDDAPEGAAEELDALLEQVSGAGFQFQHVVHMLARAELDLYEDRPGDAWNRVASTWPKVVRTMLLRVQVTRVECAYLRGRCALATCAALPATDPRRAALFAEAERERNTLLAESVPWATAIAALLDAATANLHGKADAASLLARAADQLDKADMRLLAMSARLVSDAWATRADDPSGARAWMEAQGVQDPDRLARLYVPGGEPGCGGG
jgi:hypothetical protein